MKKWIWILISALVLMGIVGMIIPSTDVEDEETQDEKLALSLQKEIYYRLVELQDSISYDDEKYTEKLEASYIVISEYYNISESELLVIEIDGLIKQWPIPKYDITPYNSEYLTEIEPMLQNIKSIYDSIGGTINALLGGLIDLESFEDSINRLWYESSQNTERLRKMSPSTDCEDAHFYLKETSAGQFLALNELLLYVDDYKESHITSATDYLERANKNLNKFILELGASCVTEDERI